MGFTFLILPRQSPRMELGSGTSFGGVWQGHGAAPRFRFQRNGDAGLFQSVTHPVDLLSLVHRVMALPSVLTVTAQDDNTLLRLELPAIDPATLTVFERCFRRQQTFPPGFRFGPVDARLGDGLPGPGQAAPPGRFW